MIKRTLLNDLIDHLAAPEISLIVGARQVGKTTLLEQLQQIVQNKGERTLYLNLDYESDATHFVSQDTFLRKIALEIGSGKGYVFIDEIQRKENAGLFLKGIYDRKLPYKLIVSGSGSLELKEKIHESLVGRKRIFELLPVSFIEFFHYRTGYRYEGDGGKYLKIHPEFSRNLLTEYLSFGGYPRMVTEERQAEKQRVLDEIYRSYIDKDITALLRLERPDAFNRMIQLSAGQTGKMVTISEWAAYCGVAAATVQRYLWYAERTYILRLLTPYYANRHKEITKSPVVYFNDLGLRNYSAGLYGQMVGQREASFLFQNLIYNMLVESARWQNWSIHFWRTIDRAEVDFVIDFIQTMLPLEVKYSEMVKPVIGRSLSSFIHKYQPAEAWVINLSLEAELKSDRTLVRFLPFYELGSDRLLQASDEAHPA